jgi:hypothetical protein
MNKLFPKSPTSLEVLKRRIRRREALRKACQFCFLIVFSTIAVKTVADPASNTNPMSGFSDYIGGRWQSQATEQTYRWGPDQSSVFAESFSNDGNHRILNASGLWYFDPSSSQIKGVFVASNMPFVILHYTTRFKAGWMISTILSVDREGHAREYLERQRLSPDKRAYQWTLTDAQDPATTMSARFLQTKSKP